MPLSSTGELRRALGLFDATMINAGTMIASAIFIVPGDIAQRLGASGSILSVWLIGGLVSLCGALCLAELGAAMPEAGGQYVYLGRIYGPLVGFLYGWAAFLVINTASIAAIAVGFATYLGVFISLSAWGIKLVAVASIVGLTLLNCLGIREGAVTQNVFTTLKIGALLAVVALGFGLSSGGGGAMEPVWRPDGDDGTVAGFGVAMVLVLWAYDGWIESSYVGSEIRNPERNLPLSIVLSTALVAVVYLLVNAAYLWVLGPARIAGSALVAADAMAVLLGPVGVTLVTAAIVISTLGANNGIVFTSARIPYAMARERRFFQWAGHIHPRFRTPVVVLLVQMGLATLLALTGSYSQLATYVVFVSFLFYAMSALGVIVLRRREPGMTRPYRAWGYPVTPIVFILFALYLVTDAIIQTPGESAVGAVIVLAGIPAYFYWARRAEPAAPSTH